MSAEPFAGFNPRPSAWGYNWRTAEEAPAVAEKRQMSPPPQPSSSVFDPQLAHLPAALLGSLKRDKKPFTYTPGGVNLSEVLNARLQKRLERKQRYCEERQPQPHQVMVEVRSTYNTPLDMYSVENALEALEVQAELAAADKSLGSPSRSATLPRNHTFRCPDAEREVESCKGVTQSKAFRVLQIITDTEQEGTDEGRPQHRDEMRFTGIRDSRSIPSRFFHTLQKITGTDDCAEGEEEEPPQQHHVYHQHKDAPPQMRLLQQSERLPVSKGSSPPPQQQRPMVDGVHPSATLKRPAAFLPIKTTPGTGFRPVRPPPFSNGIAGTDF